MHFPCVSHVFSPFATKQRPVDFSALMWTHAQSTCLFQVASLHHVIFCVIHLSNMQWQHQICCQSSTRFNTPCPRNGRSSPQSVNLSTSVTFVAMLWCAFTAAEIMAKNTREKDRTNFTASLCIYIQCPSHNDPQHSTGKGQKAACPIYEPAIKGWMGGGDWCKSNKARPNKEENQGKLRNITNITINKTKIRQLETLGNQWKQ